MLRFYPASRASIPERPEMWRKMREQGWPLVATWIDVAGPGMINDWGSFWRTCVREARDADAVLLYVHYTDLPMKGALVEVGAALGNFKEVYVIIDGFPDEMEFSDVHAALGSWSYHPDVSICGNLRDLRVAIPEAWDRELNRLLKEK